MIFASTSGSLLWRRMLQISETVSRQKPECTQIGWSSWIDIFRDLKVLLRLDIGPESADSVPSNRTLVWEPSQEGFDPD